jgi:hypothetical protein
VVQTSNGRTEHPEPQPVVTAGAVYASAARKRTTPPRPHHTTVSRNGARRRREKTSDGAGKKRLVLALAAILVAVAGAGFHTFVMPLMVANGPEPKAALAMMETLRRSPAKGEDATIEAVLNKQLDLSRRSGNLRSYQGWHIQPSGQGSGSFLIVFSYEETDNSVHSAEWLADLSTKTFTPQTDLAKSLSGD